MAAAASTGRWLNTAQLPAHRTRRSPRRRPAEIQWWPPRAGHAWRGSAVLAADQRACDGFPVTGLAVDAVDAFERHLRAERGRSEHTTRAYLGDVRSLLTFLAEDCGLTDLADLSLRDLRTWLASLADSGAARSTIARRSAAARTFLSWAARTGRIPSDPSLRLVAPKRQQHLPGVLKQSEAAALLDVAAVAADDQDPLHLRDRAALELLYASGIRVGELTALDIDDVDHDAGVVRVMGKGSKERTVPFGVPAREAMQAWLDPRQTSGRDGRERSRAVPRQTGPAGRSPSDSLSGPRPSGPRGGCAGPRPARTAAQRRHPPPGGRRGPARSSRRCSATPRWPRPRSTPTSRSTGSGSPTSRPTRAPEASGVPFRRRTGWGAAVVGSQGRKVRRPAGPPAALGALGAPRPSHPSGSRMTGPPRRRTSGSR